jgi:hypothetical protein
MNKLPFCLICNTEILYCSDLKATGILYATHPQINIGHTTLQNKYGNTILFTQSRTRYATYLILKVRLTSGLAHYRFGWIVSVTDQAMIRYPNPKEEANKKTVLACLDCYRN